jgi:hypothetical protein
VLAIDETCQDHGSGCNVVGRHADKVSVVEGHFHDESSNILSPLVLVGLLVEQSEPCFGRRSTKVPVDCAEDMTFHLDKGRFVVGLAAHFRQLLDEWDPILLVLKLGSGPKSGASDELVVLFVNDSLGNVSVD